jgi:cysteine desulfurase
MKPDAYLDYHATTPVDPRVLDAMWPYFAEQFGNPASRSHAAGRDASHAVERARAQVGRFIGAPTDTITFTGGATESNNLALKGLLRASPASHASHATRIVTIVTEHHSVLATCDALEREGYEIARLPVGSDGLVDLDVLQDALRTATRLVSIMLANGEIGVLQPIAEIASIVHAAGALLHTDASQAAGKIPVNVQGLGVDLMSLTAHKMYGPKGIGALFIRSNVGPIEPILHGGGQEDGRRSGTLNVPAIVGFGAAAEIAMTEVEDDGARVGTLRDRLLSGLLEAIPDVRINGSMTARLPHNLHVSVPGVDARMLGQVIDDLAVSTGSACASGEGAPSYVLSALGLPDDLARASIRFGLGRWTTTATIDHAVERVGRTVRELRSAEVELGR